MKSKIELNFGWEARFQDGTVIKQFDNGTENKFQKVKDKFDELVHFDLVHKSKPLRIIVDLVRGLIFLNHVPHGILDDEFISKKGDEKENIRLIFFRRNKVEMDIRGEIISHNVWYFIGYQYNDKEGRNHKVLFKLDQEGDFILGVN